MQSGLDVNSLRQVLALSGFILFFMIAYAAILINTLIKIWHDKSKDNQQRMIWFAFVLLLSPIGLPAYYYLAWKEKKSQPQSPNAELAPEVPSVKAGLSTADTERELARLLEMKKNGVLNKEEFERAKKRLES